MKDMTNPLNEKPYRKWHRIAFYILVLGFVLVGLSCIISFAAGSDNRVAYWLGIAAIVCVVLYYGINMVKWRCPNCHKPLPMIGPVIECRYCKRSFMDSKGNQVW